MFKTIFGGSDKISWGITETELPCFSIARKRFIDILIQATYEKILFETMSTIMLDEDEKKYVISTCMDRYVPVRYYGLIHWVSEAMTHQKTLRLKKIKQSDGSYIFEEMTASRFDGLLKKNEITERDVLELDFTNYDLTDLIRAIFNSLYDALNSAARGIKISNGLVIFLEDLVDLLKTPENRDVINDMVGEAVNGIKNGDFGYLSQNSRVEFAKYDIEPTEKSITFCFQQLSNYTGFAVSFFNGTGGSSLSDTGKSDEKQNRRAINFFFGSVLNPILTSIFLDKSFDLKPDSGTLEMIPTLLSSIEMSEDLNNDGKMFLYAQLGLRKEHITFSNNSNKNNESGGE